MQDLSSQPHLSFSAMYEVCPHCDRPYFAPLKGKYELDEPAFAEHVGKCRVARRELSEERVEYLDSLAWRVRYWRRTGTVGISLSRLKESHDETDEKNSKVIEACTEHAQNLEKRSNHQEGGAVSPPLNLQRKHDSSHLRLRQKARKVRPWT